jgi:photosystem II stability/assembly factor-like uncharacterized protein
MKTIKGINHAVALVMIAAMLIFTASCKKEYFSSGGYENGKHIPLDPWQMVSSGVSASQRGIIEMSAADQIACYGIVIDESNFLGNPLHDITVTHDGGKSWQSQTIPGLDNNYLFGVAATTPNIVHVFGYNYVNGGGNVFRSKDGGDTWQREAANAYTDPASFPDVIKFFDAQNGVIFGDPRNGYFEIYTTSDGGNSWNRVPSNQIPAPLSKEQGFLFFADTYNNTIWMITANLDNNGIVASERLLQSDDKGEHWYVRNSSLPFNTSSDNLIKFRNKSVGLYKENATLYRTTNGGTTWNKVNYSGTWFSHGIDNVPGAEGWWISTGGIDNFYPTNSAKGIGSSISYDDGNHWVTIDTAVNHTVVKMTSPTHGYSGGITTGSGNDGVFVYNFHPHS